MQKGLHIIYGTAKSGKDIYMKKLIKKDKDNNKKALLLIEGTFRSISENEDVKESRELLIHWNYLRSFEDLIKIIKKLHGKREINSFFVDNITLLKKSLSEDILKELYNLTEQLNITIVCQVQTRRLLENEKEPYFLFPYPAILHKVYIEGDELFFERKHSTTKEHLGKASYKLNDREEK